MGSFAEHVKTSMKKKVPSQNLVIAMKGKCILSKDVPVSIELNDKEYRLAGLVKGDGVHAWAITLKDDKFWEWNDGSVKEIKECDTENV